MGENRMERQPVGRLMLNFCAQTTLSMMAYNLYMITDTIYVSKGVGGVASGAIGIVSPVLILINGISSTLGAGGASVLSRKLGEKNYEEGKKIIGCVVWLWLIASLLISILGCIFIKPLLYALGCTEEIYPYAVQYGRIMLLSCVTSTGFSALMRAQGDSFYSTLQWCIPIVVNMSLDPLFIYHYNMGIRGAALATAMAQICTFGCSIYYFFFRKKTDCKCTPTYIRWDKKVCASIVSVGVPVVIGSMCGTITGVLTNKVLNQVGGTFAISVYLIVSRIQHTLLTPMLGVAQGILPLLGFSYGKKRTAQLRKTIHYATRFNLIYGIVVFLLLSVGSNMIVSLFTMQKEILVLGTKAMRIIGFSFLFNGLLPIVQSYFQALGKWKNLLFLTLVTTFFIRIPIIIMVGKLKNQEFLWWALVYCECIAAVWALKEYKKALKGEHENE